MYQGRTGQHFFISRTKTALLLPSFCWNFQVAFRQFLADAASKYAIWDVYIGFVEEAFDNEKTTYQRYICKHGAYGPYYIEPVRPKKGLMPYSSRGKSLLSRKKSASLALRPLRSTNSAAYKLRCWCASSHKCDSCNMKAPAEENQYSEEDFSFFCSRSLDVSGGGWLLLLYGLIYDIGREEQAYPF